MFMKKRLCGLLEERFCSTMQLWDLRGHARHGLEEWAVHVLIEDFDVSSGL